MLTTDPTALRRSATFYIRHDVTEALREYVAQNRLKLNACVEEAFVAYLRSTAETGKQGA